MKRSLSFRAMFLTISLAVFGLLVLMFMTGKTVRNSYSQPDEPKNAYLVHMFERGMVQEQVLCTMENRCVEFASMGMHSYSLASLEIGGETYVASLQTPRISTVYAAGVYCPGAIEMYSCFKVSVLTEGESCPASIEYLGFNAPLVKESCIVE